MGNSLQNLGIDVALGRAASTAIRNHVTALTRSLPNAWGWIEGRQVRAGWRVSETRRPGGFGRLRRPGQQTFALLKFTGIREADYANE